MRNFVENFRIVFGKRGLMNLLRVAGVIAYLVLIGFGSYRTGKFLQIFLPRVLLVKEWSLLSSGVGFFLYAYAIRLVVKKEK